MPPRPIYSRQDLIRIGFQAKIEIMGAFARTHGIPPEIVRPLVPPMDCYQVQQVLEAAQGEEAGTRMPGRTTKSA